MTEVNAIFYAESDLIFVKFFGVVTPEIIKEQIAEQLTSKSPRNSMWDYTDATIKNIKAKDIKEFAKLAKEITDTRPDVSNGKCAVIVKNKLAFGLARMFENMLELNKVLFKTKVFNNIDAARKWIDNK